MFILSSNHIESSHVTNYFGKLAIVVSKLDHQIEFKIGYKSFGLAVDLYLSVFAVRYGAPTNPHMHITK